MKSPLEQAQHLKKGCGIKNRWDFDLMQYCGEEKIHKRTYYCEECKAKQQTLLETCEWILYFHKEYKIQAILIDDEIKQAISICKEILK